MTAPTPAEVVEPLVPMVGVDDVGLVVGDVGRGTLIRTAAGVVEAIDDIPASHKVAVRGLAAGAPVHKYGEVIGIAQQDIRPGAHVHLHNLGVGSLTANAAPFVGAPTAWVPPAAPTRAQFLGYRRPDGGRRLAITSPYCRPSTVQRQWPVWSRRPPTSSMPAHPGSTE